MAAQKVRSIRLVSLHSVPLICSHSGTESGARVKFMAHISSIATAVPPYVFSQREIFELGKKVYSDHQGDFSRFEAAFFNTEIEQRFLSAPGPWFLESRTWRDRNQLYIRQALDLLEEVALKAIEKSNYQLQDITDILTVSTTGVATPSLDALLMDRLKFNSQIRRTPIFGLGCAGGLIGLKRADQIAKENDKNVVLLLVVELCSLNFMKDKFTKQDVIASALFSDGAAAAVVSQDSAGPFINFCLEHRWPRSVDIMGWEVTEKGLSVIFSRSIPELVKNEFPKIYRTFLKDSGLDYESFKHFLSHPGGAKVVDELELVFGVRRHSMAHTREILKNYGNMSAPTVLFVLERAVELKEKGKSLLSTFGPGFTTALMEVEL